MPSVESAGATISYTTSGAGPSLLLVHGGLLGPDLTWVAVRPRLEARFTVHTIARRGRKESSNTRGHTVEDEASDIIRVLEAIGPAHVVAHSYGALCALAAAVRSPAMKSLTLYEPPLPDAASAARLALLEEPAARRDWQAVVEQFWRDSLQLPAPVVETLKHSPIWAPSVADAEASMEDIRAVVNYSCRLDEFAAVRVPVLLLIGSETPDDGYHSRDLDAVLPDSRIAILEGQGHAAMLTAPDDFLREVETFTSAHP